VNDYVVTPRSNAENPAGLVRSSPRLGVSAVEWICEIELDLSRCLR